MRCCHIGQSHFGQTPLEAGERRGGEEVGYKGREEGGKDREGEQKSKREEEKIEFKVARSGEPDSMPRLATEGKKVGEARREVVEEASQAQSDKAKPKEKER